MKKFAIILLAAFSAVSFSNDTDNGPLDEKIVDKEVFENKSYYETLGDMFQSGAKPEVSKLIEVVWSGRCFKKTNPYKPISSAYHFRKKRNEHVGPLGDNVTFYEALSLFSLYKIPNYFDDKDLLTLLTISRDYRKVSIRSKSYEITFSNGNKSALRVSGEYLVEELRDIPIGVGPLGKEYEVFGRCYYFIPEYHR